MTSRGNNRGLITFDGTDRAGLRGELAAAATKHKWEVFAWCLMPNHYHVILRAPEGAASSGFQELNGNHARRTNRRHGRIGHLFQNRFYCGELASKSARSEFVRLVGSGQLLVSDTGFEDRDAA